VRREAAVAELVQCEQGRQGLGPDRRSRGGRPPCFSNSATSAPGGRT
jgi:hypothetical protein